MSVKRGKLITFEGAEAVGKSTQIKLLSKALVKRGHQVFCTREPGGSLLGEKLRKLVKGFEMSPEAELFLLEASRTELVQSEILPRLRRGEIVICDRFQESSLVYQGMIGGLPLKEVRRSNSLATGDLQSDLIVWLDLSDSELKKRLRSRVGSQDRFDSRKFSFHQRLTRAYRKLAKTQRKPKLWRFDASQAPAELQRQILKLVDRHLKIR